MAPTVARNCGGKPRITVSLAPSAYTCRRRQVGTMRAVRKITTGEESPQGAFLGVERSLRGLQWRERLEPAARNSAIAISQRYGLPELLGRVLAGRGVGLDEVPNVLEPRIKALMPNPSSLRDMDKAAVRLA